MRNLIIWLICGLGALTIFILFFSHAFPVASVDIKIEKDQAVKLAADFIQAQGFDLHGFDRTIVFDSDYHASVYLQKTQKIKKSNQLIRSGIPVWFWRIRWFKELEKEGFIVCVDPASGEIVYFLHRLLEDQPGANLAEQRAEGLARDKVTLQNVDLAAYTLKDSTIEQRKLRTDYSFSWEKRDYQIAEARLRVDLEIYGDQLGKYRRYLKVPEEFRRYVRGELAFGRMLATVTRVLKYVLIILAVFVLFFKSQQGRADWKIWLSCAGIVGLFDLAYFFNNLPLWWSHYPDTISKTTFITEAFSQSFTQALSLGLLVLACGALGQLSAKDAFESKTPVYHAFKAKRFNSAEIAPVFVVGYSLGFIFLGYITLFYLLGARWFDIWIPPKTEYSNIFGMTLPILFPLIISLTAAVKEELLYRFFAVTFLGRFLKKRWLSLLIPALIWGFAHSFYHVFPTYVRGIELTIFGIVFGLVFLKYGLETVIIAHFVIDAVLAGLPLLRSHSPYLVGSGVFVIGLAFLPIIALVILRMRK
ncbi:lysostaphin resistance A-like protein [Candidatus Omnitrophota bacterium]